MLNKGELTAFLRKHNIRPNKRLGQNFLVDKNMQQKMLQYCNLSQKDIVLEIGPGLGALTFDIARLAEKVFAVEKDERLSGLLKELTSGYGNINVISGDILKFDMEKICRGRKIKVIGNLPYYITSPIMAYLIENKKCISSIFLTLQKEVGGRLIAGPGGKDYSPISIFTQFYTKPRILFLVARGVFYPKPEVDSVFLQLEVLESPAVKAADEALFFKLVKRAFSARRKTILNTLSSANASGLDKRAVDILLRNLNISPASRPECLSLQDFAAITNTLYRQ